MAALAAEAFQWHMSRIVLSTRTIKIFEKTILLAASFWESRAEQPPRILLTKITLPYKSHVFWSGGQLQAITGARVHRVSSLLVAEKAVFTHDFVKVLVTDRSMPPGYLRQQ